MIYKTHGVMRFRLLKNPNRKSYKFKMGKDLLAVLQKHSFSLCICLYMRRSPEYLCALPSGFSSSLIKYLLFRHSKTHGVMRFFICVLYLWQSEK